MKAPEYWLRVNLLILAFLVGFTVGGVLFYFHGYSNGQDDAYIETNYDLERLRR